MPGTYDVIRSSRQMPDSDWPIKNTAYLPIAQRLQAKMKGLYLMAGFDEKQRRCKLCGNSHSDSDMSEEHYPARNTGNEDVVAVYLGKMFETFTSESIHAEIREKLSHGERLENITGDIFDTQLATSLFPKGRTARTLCRKCNTFLRKYDESYLRFFNLDGNPKSINGFQLHTKYQIIKAIYAKFLSIPEAASESFDFIDFRECPAYTLLYQFSPKDTGQSKVK